MKSEESAGYFRKGFNCAQSVFVPFAKERGLAEEEALRIAAGFGAGMVRTQATCGAATGGLMALGLAKGYVRSDDAAGRAAMLAAGKALFEGFLARFGHLSCADLLGCDLNTEAGRARHEAEGQREGICVKCVEWASGEADRLSGVDK
jgi:C_GCAxxG_C_C family probable redox protein